MNEKEKCVRFIGLRASGSNTQPGFVGTLLLVSIVSIMSSNDFIQQVKHSLKALDVKRQSLEKEAEAIVSELTDRSNGEPMGVDTPLTDREGYPRADIDVYRARTLRGRLAVIRTDLNAIMKDIERHLQQLASLQKPELSEQEQLEMNARKNPKPKPKYDPVTGKWVVMNWDGTISGAPGGGNRNFHNLTASAQNTDAVTGVQANQAQHTLAPDPRPFARVDSVAAHAPAEQAGLLEGDLILEFGNVSLDSTNDPMREVGELLPKAAANQTSISLKVRRDHEVMTLQLKPQPWSGRGLLGCHILPYSA